MTFIKKILPVLLGCTVLFSFAVSFPSSGSVTILPADAAAETAAPADTAKSVKPAFPIKKNTQNTIEELDKQYPMDAPVPSNVKSVVEYDAKSGNYVLRTFVGSTEIATPFLMTDQEYRDYSAKQEMMKYWREKNAKLGANNEDKFSVTDMKFNLGPAEKVFGPGGIQIKTQGSAELLFGYKTNKLNNPALTERMRKTGIFDFDEKIQMNVTGQVGDKINLGLNYNTESSFDFDQKMVKLAYKGKEDDIIKSLEAGNVSMQLNSSLISGSTALFGIKTELQFGRLSVSAIASQQESESQTVSSKGGVQTTPFEVNVDNYDENRHFFLSHYFRGKFEDAMSTLPLGSSGVTIKRVELWVTNKRYATEHTRNIVALMDLGEPKRIGNTTWVNTTNAVVPQNEANTQYNAINTMPNVRDIQQTNVVLAQNTNMVGGEEFEKIESARLLDASEYVLNANLGFVSLRQALNPDEVLACAFEYTYNGKVYQVGELSTDAGKTSEAMVVKLLKGTVQVPQLPIWDLMMKNVYNIGALQLQPEKFKLDVVYRNDSIGTDMQYITEGNIKNQALLRVMNLDHLDVKNNPVPDGRFDYVEGSTVQSATGRIIFPVLEPFGSHLATKIGDPTLAKKYTYPELYDSTLVVAQAYSERNKFRIVGEYKASSGTEIRLNAMNVPRGSVTVSAGGAVLKENVDYTVDYTMGTVTIINNSIVESGTKIDVKLENQSMFSMQRKTLLGTHLEYKFNKDFTVGGTLMHLSEMPLTKKVNTGSEPISNTIWGMNTSWRGESQWLTNMLDKLPFVHATKPSTLTLNAEFAKLSPGHSSVISSSGLAYLDDFESTKTSIDIHYPTNWYLASTPYDPSSSALFPEAKNPTLDYGKNRALLSWYYVDPLLNGDSKSTPQNLRDNADLQSNHLTRNVLETEIFPYKQTLATQSPRMTVLNLSYYPTERGPYNLDVDGMNPDGTLMNPAKRWGGIMRKMETTDFETSNIEYIEFWMMDPFIYHPNDASYKGNLYFNLGDVSEDILKDGKKGFENGLPIDGDISKATSTIWGVVSKSQSTVNAFDNTKGARQNQDVGLDGLSTTQEFTFPSYQNYVNQLKTKLNQSTKDKMMNDPFSPLRDPSGDNYHFYRGSDYDDEKLNILERYKHYNGTEGNSPESDNVNETYGTTATSLPDIEDINNDNTLNEYEKYYQYKVAIDPTKMNIGDNFITDKIERDVDLKNGKTEKVSWYQFKIPVREFTDKVGNIRNFKSIRFIRMFLTGFEKETHLRFATLDLVRGEWRNFIKPLYTGTTPPVQSGSMDVQAVNVEENSNKSPVNYVLPPGVSRETDPSQSQLLQQNEQAMVLRVSDLAPKDARGVYKNTSFDMRQYKKLQMFVHAEKMTDDNTNLKDNELTCFVRLGSDMVNNYYEYEIPLALTPAGQYTSNKASDREIVWNPQNMFNFTFETLINAKLERNKARANGTGGVQFNTPFTIYDPNFKINKVTVVGNPSISDVKNILIGVRNQSGEVKSGEIWVNELRMSEFDESGGWAAMGNMALGLSDIGTINMAGRAESAGFGGLESNMLTRRLDDLRQISVSSAIDVGRFLPEKAKLQIPTYFTYTNETVTPKYNPLDQDVRFNDALDNMATQSQKDSLKSMSQTVNSSKSFNITGAKFNIKSKTPKFYDPANVTVSYAYTETNQHSAEIEQNLTKDQRAAVDYSFMFNPQPWEPFKKLKFLDNPVLKIVKEFNLNYMPSAISYNNNMNRRYTQLKLRDLNAASSGLTDNMDISVSKDFMWNRQFDIKYDPTRSLKLELQTVMNASIEEPLKTPEMGKEYYDSWRDSVWSKIKQMGRPYAYQQVFNASWNVPINKLPLLDWTTLTATYRSNYNWNRMADVKVSDTKTKKVGNIATSTGDWQFEGNLNFENLYNKWKYLKDVNRRFNSQPASNNRAKFQPKTYNEIVNLAKGKAMTINHRLGSDKFKLTATDKNGKLVSVPYKVKNPTTIEINPDMMADSVKLSLVSVDPNSQPVAKTTVDFVARMLMMVRKVSFTYHESNSMTLPGFKNEPGFLGQKYSSPGMDYVFGFQSDNVIDKALRNDWLVMDSTVVNPATKAYTSMLDLKATLEPIPGLKVELNARRETASNTSIQYMFENMPTSFTGSYNITLIALSTAFKPIGDATNNYNSSVFNTFLENRQVIADKMNNRYSGRKYPNSGFLVGRGGIVGKDFDPGLGAYTTNSPDVLIPAFLAAYTGRDVHTMSTNPFLALTSVLPNWRISFDGLSNIGWVKDHFKSVSINHAYTCRYSIGSYTSYSTWVAAGNDDSALGYIRDVKSNNPLPSSPYDISSVNLNEQFMPLIGINVAMKNSMTAKIEFAKQRNISLNLTSAQLIESATDEYKVGLGYVVKDFDVILNMKNKQASVKNDLKISADFSYKDIKTLLRKLEENLTQASSGNKLLTLKIMADYVFSSKMNIQLFYDRQVTTPLISSSFPVATSNFGMSFKFMLTR